MGIFVHIRAWEEAVKFVHGASYEFAFTR